VTDNLLKPINLPPDQLKNLLNVLDEVGGQCSKKNLRRSKRTRYRTVRAVVHVLDHRGEEEISFCAPTRNLSSGGMAFLHKQMLPVEQRLKIEIPILEEQPLAVMARVARCQHVKGMIHEIGVEFLGVVNPAD